jgi:hypothetical protein
MDKIPKSRSTRKAETRLGIRENAHLQLKRLCDDEYRNPQPEKTAYEVMSIHLFPNLVTRHATFEEERRGDGLSNPAGRLRNASIRRYNTMGFSSSWKITSPAGCRTFRIVCIVVNHRWHIRT